MGKTKLIQCPACKHEMSKSAEKCPNCGHKKENKFFKIVGFIFLFCILVSIFDSHNKNKVSLNSSNFASNEKSNFQILSHNFCYGEFNVKEVCGIVANNSNRSYNYVQVEINLYDKQGILLGSTLSNINNFEANSKWKFSAPILYDSVYSYKIKGITSF